LDVVVQVWFRDDDSLSAGNQLVVGEDVVLCATTLGTIDNGTAFDAEVSIEDDSNVGGPRHTVSQKTWLKMKLGIVS